MKIFFCFCFLLINTTSIFSQSYNIDSNKLSSTATILKDSSGQEKLVPENEFYYANNKRYTILGSRPNLTTKIKPIPAVILGSVFAGIFIVQHEMQQNTIWKDVGPFNIQEDGQWTYYLDKGGHFYGSYMPSYLMSEILMTSGFSWDLSTILGSVFGLCYTGYVEVLDGYSKGFGFSPSDFYADILGSSFFLAQHYIPVLQNFTPKFQYVKPSWIGEKNRRPSETFIDDYSAQTFWMGVNVHNLLPKSINKYWPK